MEDKNKLSTEKDSKPQRGSGAMLAAARKAQNKSIEEIADELNLSLTQLRTIELDQSEGLPEPTYVRGYIRSYAKLLGLNPEDVLNHYLDKNWQRSANLDDMPRGISDSEASSGGFLSPGKVIAVLVLAGLLAFFWFSGGFSGLSRDEARYDEASLESLDSSEPSEVSSESGLSENSTVNSEGTAPDAVSDVIDSSESEAQSISNEPTNDPAPAVEPAPSVVDTQTRVVLTFTETSWVDIRDEAQNRLAYRSYPVGETLDVAAEGALSVLIGNAKGVNMTLNGEPYDLSQHTRGVYAKFSVGQPSE